HLPHEVVLPVVLARIANHKGSPAIVGRRGAEGYQFAVEINGRALLSEDGRDMRPFPEWDRLVRRNAGDGGSGENLGPNHGSATPIVVGECKADTEFCRDVTADEISFVAPPEDSLRVGPGFQGNRDEAFQPGHDAALPVEDERLLPQRGAHFGWDGVV